MDLGTIHPAGPQHCNQYNTKTTQRAHYMRRTFARAFKTRQRASNTRPRTDTRKMSKCPPPAPFPSTTPPTHPPTPYRLALLHGHTGDPRDRLQAELGHGLARLLLGTVLLLAVLTDSVATCGVASGLQICNRTPQQRHDTVSELRCPRKQQLLQRPDSRGERRRQAHVPGTGAGAQVGANEKKNNPRGTTCRSRPHEYSSQRTPSRGGRIMRGSYRGGNTGNVIRIGTVNVLNGRLLVLSAHCVVGSSTGQ